MKVSDLPFCDTKSFSSLILDYLNEDQKIKEFYAYQPSLEGIYKAASKRKFSSTQRELLVDRLFSQYDEAGIKIKGKEVEAQINSLSDHNSFTITTGHQLCLLGGPLYFIYKIASIIKLSRSLKRKYSEYDFIPVFWMASEDHDFEEIDHFYFQGKKFQWSRNAQGAVGRLDTGNIAEVFQQFKEALPEYSSHASKLVALISSTYLKFNNYAQASRHLVHQIFGEEGLLIIDGDDPELKRSFIPEMREELLEFSTEINVNQQSEGLGRHYKLQVNPRQINLFYFNSSESQAERGTPSGVEERSQLESRERIEKTAEGYALAESGRTFSSEDLMQGLQDRPEDFSPNVLMRPLYQEKILPNLAYIGGGGELAYWFQLKQNFDHFNIDFPVLVLRNSCLYIDEQQSKISKGLGVNWKDLFMREGDLIKQWTIRQNEELLIQREKNDFASLWENLKQKTLSEDKGLGPFVEAQEAKMNNWLDRLSNKLIRAQRRKEEQSVEKIRSLKAELFPSGSLQERRESFVELYLIYGEELVPNLIEAFHLPTDRFLILEI